MDLRHWQGKVAFVTGAAGGIGGAVARSLGERGVRVAAADNDPERLRRTVKELANDGLAVAAFPTDVAVSSEVESVVGQVERQLGPIDFLVNAAGVLRVGEARLLSDQDWSATFAVNTAGVFFVSRAVVNRMVPRGGGAVVTVASNAASIARTEMAAYAASKAAVTVFTQCLGLEVARYGIRCNVVAPGSTDTEMLSALWSGTDWRRASIDGVPEAFRVGIPLGKVARPVDVADAVLFLLSERAGHITMHNLTVDGGAALGAR
jgi:2,3-dihydro-2,3-dihydroxybenzoate dehydrogenase